MHLQNLLCLNPMCSSLSLDNVKQNLGTCSDAKCITMLRIFGHSDMVPKYEDHITIYKQAPQMYEANFMYVRDSIRSEIENNMKTPHASLNHQRLQQTIPTITCDFAKLQILCFQNENEKIRGKIIFLKTLGHFSSPNVIESSKCPIWELYFSFQDGGSK